MNVDWKYIRMFVDISVKNVCCDLGLQKDYMNIISGKASKAKIRLVRVEIEKRLMDLKKANEL